MSARPAPDRLGAYILTGGASRRMGVDKARLAVDGRPLALALAERFSASVAGVWLVAKDVADFADLGLPTIVDRTPERALVHGIRAVLDAPGPEWRWILACDMPNVTDDVLTGMWETLQRAQALGCCARLDARAGLEPLPSLWHESLSSRIQPDWDSAAQAWVRAAGLAVWDAPPALHECWQNINTRDEWRRFERRRADRKVR